jgi:thymidylate kinase
LTRIVESAVGRHLPALAAHRKIEILGVAGAGKSTLASLLGRQAGWEMAPFIHARRPSDLFQVARAIPHLLTVLLRGVTQRPRVSWREIKLLVYVTRWRHVLRRRQPGAGTTLLFDQGPIYALVRLRAEGKPFTAGRAYERWSEEMLERWASELTAVIFLDAPDAVLWSRINDRPQNHAEKGEKVGSGLRFITRYRRSFSEVLGRAEEIGGPRILRFDTGKVTADRIAEQVGSAVRTRR